MKKISFILVLGLLMACDSQKESATTEQAMEPHLEAVQKEFAPDSRVVLFDLEQKGNVLKGETNQPKAKQALLERLQKENIDFVDSIEVLPTKEFEGTTGVINLSVANLRSSRGHSSELSTQATMGTPVKVYKKTRGWYFVQTPDNYLAWVDGGGLTLMNENKFSEWKNKPKIIYTKAYGFSHEKKDKEAGTVSDLVYGDVLGLEGEEKGFYAVSFPDGRTGYVATDEAIPYNEWVNRQEPSGENLVSISKQFLGLPYLWGGTSFKGVDCSGFTKTVYFLNGLILPRDASQQVNMGETVDTSNGWKNMEKGDLLFFGSPAKDGRPERVVHVGMWIGGDEEFIHSSGKVRISSMNPNAENYDKSQLNRFLRAKRITPDDVVIDLRETKLY